MERKFWPLTQNTKEKRECASLFRPSSRDHLGNDEAPRAGFLGGACPSGGVVGGFSDIGAVVVNGVGGARIVGEEGHRVRVNGRGRTDGQDEFAQFARQRARRFGLGKRGGRVHETQFVHKESRDRASPRPHRAHKSRRD